MQGQGFGRDEAKMTQNITEKIMMHLIERCR